MNLFFRKIFFFVGFFSLFLCIQPSSGKIIFHQKNNFPPESIFFQENLFSNSPILLTDSLHLKKKRKWIAAVLAFPIPFGIFGLHRWYLGSSKGMPWLYIATFGGGFGTLPFIDFMVIIIDNDMTRYSDNQKLFMWGKHKIKK